MIVAYRSVGERERLLSVPSRDLRRSRHPKPYPKAALAGPQWNREAGPLRDILGYTSGL
jgi:hypothetical protein